MNFRTSGLKNSNFYVNFLWDIEQTLNTILIHNFVIAMLTKFQHVFMCILRNIEFVVSYCLLSKLLDRALVNEFFDPSKS
jgi:uncharacterized membrane protein YfbV (UPF0208 family)